MTEPELIKYKQDFKKIVYLKGEITSKKNHIGSLCTYDRNDSHKAAILKAIKQKGELQTQFIEKLNGFDYHYMMDSLRKATILFKKADKTKFLAFNPFIDPKKNITVEKRKCVYCDNFTAGKNITYCDDHLHEAGL